MATFDLDRDELDIITPTTTDQFYAISAPVHMSLKENDAECQLRRSMRIRKAIVKIMPESTKPRKRALSTSTIQNTEKREQMKRQKLDEKKSIAPVNSVRKETRDTARKNWLLRHRDLFEPLLPSSHTVFKQYTEDVKTSSLPPCRSFRQLDEQPTLIKGGIMKDYQTDGLSYLVWMYLNGMNCILGDEMGLGKTLQTLALFAWIKENIPGSHDPHLIICPLSVLSSWQAEAAHWVPSMRTVRFHGPASERKRLKESLKPDEYDIMITTYDSYVAEDSWFKSRRWTYCVLDEGHKIKNAETNVAGTVQGLGSLYRLILTGTPLQNNLVELWSLLHWLYPFIFTPATERLFRDSFNLTLGKYSLSFLTHAKNLLAKIMLRRTKAAVEVNVPPKEELTLFIPMSELQRFWTYRLLTKMDTPDFCQVFGNPGKVENSDVKKGVLTTSHASPRPDETNRGTWKKLMNLLLQLRKVCDHPYLLVDAEPSPYSIGEHIISSSSKLVAIDKLLGDILPKGERVLIFSQWTGMLDVLEDFMTFRSIRYARLEGSTPRPRRALDIRLFQQENSPYQVYLVSTKAGGLGINLTKATHVIMCDSDWNPQNDLQAIARAHRIGQTKTVKVYRLICRGSVEDQMLDRIRRKLFLSLKVMDSDNLANSEGTSLTSSELLNILRRGSSALSSDSGMTLEKFMKADIAKILEMSMTCERLRQTKASQDVKSEAKSEEVSDAQLIADAEEEERRLLSGVAQVSCRLFEGRVVERPRNNKAIAAEWHDMQKRARVNRTVRLDGMSFIVSPHEPISAPMQPAKKPRFSHESEDWCIHCRDGGELIMCHVCPRVFHARCRGISKSQVPSTMSCSQHACCVCLRNTAEAGGMLFKCRTCPQAFCEDCLPEGDIDAVGDVLPEFEVLGYGVKSTSYYIRCQDCQVFFLEKPKAWLEWQKDFQEAERKLQEMCG